jgi:hypothetical protein
MRFPLIGEEPEEEEIPWNCHMDVNSHVDFCIWILEIDGLSVPPFNLHPEGDRTLQNHGLNAESWQAWLAKVIATQDPCLRSDVANIHMANMQAKTVEYISSSQDMIKQFVERGLVSQEYANQIDWSRVSIQYESLIERSQILAEQRYHQAVEELGDLLTNKNVTPAKVWKLPPPELWDGALEVGERLQELWQHYLATSQRSKYSFEQFEHLDSLPFSELQQYKEYFDYLIIHIVYYPEPVEHLLPPHTIVVSRTTELCDIEDLRVRTLRAAERLALISK